MEFHTLKIISMQQDKELTKLLSALTEVKEGLEREAASLG